MTHSGRIQLDNITDDKETSLNKYARNEAKFPYAAREQQQLPPQSRAFAMPIGQSVGFAGRGDLDSLDRTEYGRVVLQRHI